MSDFFSRLPDFIQNYIWANKWEGFRRVQVESFEVLFNTDDHLIISSGTASGKTEAAFFPCFSYMHQNPEAGVQLLYIGPLKALINDQFQRMKDVVHEADIKVFHWHGDVSVSEKKRLVKDPSGILQITPESLESLLINHSGNIKKLFQNLRFVIIDEIHAFMGQDRGSQVLCQLTRLERIASCNPRRIGLSATLSDYSSASKWLSAGTERGVQVVSVMDKRNVKLAVNHILIPANDDSKAEERKTVIESYYNYLFNLTHSKKCIVFVNSRQTAENTARGLKLIAARRSEKDEFFVHHGSISTMLRKDAEEALKDDTTQTVAIATMTLELGIDIGGLDRTVQIDAPTSCSSFVQRLGRSGRRGNASEMVFICLENELESDSLKNNVSLSLLKSIAIIELYSKEKWIEPFEFRKKPFGLLYHQTMSLVKSANEYSRKNLEKDVLSLFPFQDVTIEEFHSMLDHLIKIDHLTTMDEGNIILGLKGEKVVNFFPFYAVFQDALEYTVIAGDKKIGSVQEFKIEGESISLAGKSWIVIASDEKKKKIIVQESENEADSKWGSRGPSTHPAVMGKIRDILMSDDEYRYLGPNANSRLSSVRTFFRNNDLISDSIIENQDNSLTVFPWLGSKQFDTLYRILKYLSNSEKGITVGHTEWPFFIKVYGKVCKAELKEMINRVKTTKELHSGLINDWDQLILGKYEYLLPRELLTISFLTDGLDFNFEI